MKKLCFPKKCISVEIRDTPETRMKGLMGREDLPEEKGMLFVFETPSKYTFWMKNMKISIDMIWLDEEKRIVHIEKNVPPCKEDPCQTYGPVLDSLYVVETAPGFSSKYGLQMWDKVEFD